MSSNAEYLLSRNDLKVRAASSFALNVAARVSSVVIQLVTTTILARILMPADFGLVGMVTPVIAAFSVVGNLGFTNAVLQRDRVTGAQLSSLFYANLGVSAVFALLLFFVAPLLAGFYRTPQVAPITMLFSLVILSSGLSTLQSSLIQRDLRFGLILAAELASQLVSSVAAIAMALNGAGYLSLAWRPVVQAVVFTAMVWTCSGWFPGKPEWSADVRSIFSFGGYSVGFGLFNMLGRHSDNVMIGWRYGQAELGPYALAYRLFMWPVQMVTQPIGNVIIPALSRLRHDPARLARWYLSVVRLINFAVTPLICLAEICAGDLVRLWLGPKWLAAVPIIRWLLPVAALRVSSTTIGWLMLAYGKADRQFFWSAIVVPAYLASFAIGLPWHAVGVAIAFAVVNFILFVPGFIYGVKGSEVRVGQILSALVPGFAVGALLFAIFAALSRWTAGLSPLGELTVFTLVAIALLLAGGAATFGVREALRQARLLAAKLFPRACATWLR